MDRASSRAVQVRFSAAYNADLEPVGQADIVTPLGAFKGLGTTVLSEQSQQPSKKIVKLIQQSGLDNFVELDQQLPVDKIHKSYSEALSWALLLACVAKSGLAIHQFIQAITGNEKQNVPAPILFLTEIEECKVFVTVAFSQSMGDAAKALAEFRQKYVELRNTAQKKFNNIIELLGALKPIVKDTPIRFCVDLSWSRKNTPKGYALNPGNVLKFDEYQQMVAGLKQLDVISISNSGLDECPILQTIVKNEPQTKQERQLLEYTSCFPRVSDFLLFVKKARSTSHLAQKIAIDISKLKTEQPTIVYVLMATNIEQCLLGELGSGLSSIRINEIKRYDEQTEIVFGCQDWVLGL